jgi:hypothetical protein
MQIGPRIRIGGTLGKLGQGLKIGAGKVMSNPIAQGLAGAIGGPWAGAAVGGLGKVLDTSGGSVGLGDIAGGTLKGGAAGFAGSKLGGILKGGLGKIGGLGGLVTGGGSDGKGNFGALGDLGGRIGGAATGGLGGLLGGGGLGDNLLMGGALAATIADAKRGRDLQEKGLNYATEGYDQKADLRTQALGALKNPQPVDLAAKFQTRGRNPYAMTAPLGRIGQNVAGFARGG